MSYGTAECGNLGYECERQDGLHIPLDVLLQICDINSGQPLPEGECSEIVVTLFTRDYALVRFGTGDLSSVVPGECDCGRSSPRLAGWQGRVGDAVKVRGMFLHPRQLEQLMAGFPEVARWQAKITRQEHKDFLTLRIVAGGSEVERLGARVVAAAREQIRFLPDVEMVHESDLSPDAPPIDDTRTLE